MQIRVLICCCFSAVLFPFCSQNGSETKKEKSVVVAISQHPYTFNPIVAKNDVARDISSLVYPGLFYREYNVKNNTAAFKPQIASWSEPFGSYVMIRIKPDAKWTDDIPVNARDILYSYQLYASDELGTIWRPLLNGLKTAEDGKIDVANAITIDDDSTVTFHFTDEASVNYLVFTVPILPKHQMDALPFVQLKSRIPVKAPTIAGPFLVAGLNDQEIVLSRNDLSILPQPAKLDKIICRLLKDKKSTIEALKAGEIDVATNLTAADVAEIKDANGSMEAVAFPPRRYHVIGWNNIDPEIYRSTGGEKLKGHRLFGSTDVRRALTYAINRDEILKEVGGEQVVRAFGPISPMFTAEYHDTLHQPPFNPNEARLLLLRESWQDLTRSGTIEKYNKPFSFALKVSADDVRGIKIAEMVKKQLKDVSIDVIVESVDPKKFPEIIKEKDFDAFVGAVDVPGTLSLERYWGMNLQESDLNFVSYRNKRVADIIDSVRIIENAKHRTALWKEFQDIIQEKQPYTFLFWESQYAVKSKRLKGIAFTPDGFFSHAWDWNITD